MYSRIGSLVRILGQVEWVGGVIGVENQRGGSPVTSRVSRVAIKSQRSVVVDVVGRTLRAMKYAAFIVSAIFPALSSAYRVMTDHRVKGEPPVNTRIIKRTNYRARAHHPEELYRWRRKSSVTCIFHDAFLEKSKPRQ